MKPPVDRESTIARYMEGPALLEKAVAGLTETDLDSAPAKGGWTIRQIVHHLADGDAVWTMGIKQALGNDGSEFSLDWYRVQPQETWADRWASSRRPVDVSLALLRATRAHVAQLLEHVPDAWNRSVSFRKPDAEAEIVPVGFVIEMQASHVVHHLRQIEAILGERSGS